MKDQTLEKYQYLREQAVESVGQKLLMWAVTEVNTGLTTKELKRATEIVEFEINHHMRQVYDMMRSASDT